MPLEEHQPEPSSSKESQKDKGMGRGRGYPVMNEESGRGGNSKSGQAKYGGSGRGNTSEGQGTSASGDTSRRSNNNERSGSSQRPQVSWRRRDYGGNGIPAEECAAASRRWGFRNDERRNLPHQLPRPPTYNYIPDLEPETEEELFRSGISCGINFDCYDNIKVNVSGDDVPPCIESFEQAPLSRILQINIRKCTYNKPTPVQKYALPTIMSGRDLMVSAQTGSGKTAAYLIPTINCIFESSKSPPLVRMTSTPQLLVLAPTRELACQIYLEAKKLTHGSPLLTEICYGGTSYVHQLQRLRKGCNILVATPGRLENYLDKRAVSLQNLRHLVIDEADRMLDMNFLKSVESIIKHYTVNERYPPQILMFSATLPDEVQRLARTYLTNSVFVAVGIVGAACADVEQKFVSVLKRDKRKELIDLIKKLSPAKMLVFVEQKRTADYVAGFLIDEGFNAAAMHGDIDQPSREDALKKFRSGRMTLLVATAVASRGLDIRSIDYVINYDMPATIYEYIHRIGRTGRVGNRGMAFSFYDPENDRQMASQLARVLKQTDQEVPPFLQDGGHERGVDPFAPEVDEYEEEVAKRGDGYVEVPPPEEIW